MTPDADEAGQGCVPPTPAAIYVEQPVRHYSLLPAVSVVFLVFAILASNNANAIAVDNFYYVFRIYSVQYDNAWPLLTPAAICGIAGLIQLLWQRKYNVAIALTLVITMVSTAISLLLLAAPLFTPMERV
jgi:hypothetical protein